MARSDMGSWKDFVFDREANGYGTVVSMGDGLDERSACMSVTAMRATRGSKCESTAGESVSAEPFG